jgi:hypothetical protein
MPWSKKQRGRATGYFYHSVRIDGRPTKLYVGAGPEALRAARAVEGRRRQRLAERDARLLEEARLGAAQRGLRELAAAARLLARAALLLAGYHEHRGQWRLRRGQAG